MVKVICNDYAANGYTKQPINPGDSGLVKVFVKKEKEGYFNETITVYCNVSDSPLVLKLYGNAI